MKRILAPALIAVALCASRAPAAVRPLVLFDEGHGQQFLTGRTGELDLSNLAGIFRDAGLEIRASRGRIDAAALNGAAALIISGAFAPVTTAEAEAIRVFVGNGGRLVLMLHIGRPLQGLLEPMGIQYSRGPVHEAEGVIGGRSGDFTVTRFERHALTEGLARLSVFGCWALQSTNPQAAVIARTGAKAWLDSNGDGRRSPGEPVGAEGLVVAGSMGGGSFVVFGDDAIFQNRFLKAYNADLAHRLARWLAVSPAPAPALRPSHLKSPGVTDL